jgi:hypothetical protein
VLLDFVRGDSNRTRPRIIEEFLPAPRESKVVTARYRSLNDTAEFTGAKGFAHIFAQEFFQSIEFEPGRPPDILAESGAREITI